MFQSYEFVADGLEAVAAVVVAAAAVTVEAHSSDEDVVVGRASYGHDCA